MNRYFDTASIVVIVITFVLFVLALFTKGFTHDLFLEAGVFLVSVKLILLGYRNGATARSVERELREIKALLEERLTVES